MKQSLIENTAAENDPTAAAEHSKLLNNTLCDPSIRDLIKDLKTKKISLVLSGGGGKGAYQAGVILALYDCGIKNFASIAGTSVGALNAALCHELFRLGNRDIVLSVWNNINYKSVMGLSFGLVVKLAVFAMYCVSVLLLFPLGFFNNDPFFSYVDDCEPEDNVSYAVDQLIIRLAKILIVWLPIALVASLMLYFYYLVFQYLRSHGLVLPFGKDVNAWITIFTMAYMLPRIANVVGRRFSAFSNTPLSRTIKTLNMEEIKDGNPPVICTVAEQIPRGCLLHFRPYYEPRYMPLNTCQKGQDVADILLLGAAIPEVFGASYSIGGRRIVDGGMADNTPIFGAFEQRPDTLLVVYLDHRFGRVKNLRACENHRLASLIRGSRRWSGYDSYYNERMDWVWATDRISIIPSKSLGGFFFGTLNFMPCKARRLISLGYEDTLRQLAKAAKLGAA